MRVTSRSDDKKFLLTMIYVFNGINERQSLWEFLKQAATNCNEPWLWTGDFNTVVSHVERLGGNTIEVEMERFQECISLCCMEDIQATGALFTWSNKQEPQNRVYSRLDRAMGNFEWMQNFGDYMAHFHPEGLLNHCPCTTVDRTCDTQCRRSFKYFDMWGQSDMFKYCVANIWNRRKHGTRMFQRDMVDKQGDYELMQQECLVAQELRKLQSARDSFLIQKAKIQWSL
ncbi:uncharacterized protein LOC141649369 [Silene latifolia]|uniref:uncharacterized protein LOC141649369 n=1 Tax=Silene latifolia TaxID=37657 RepID=UPI003D777246